MIKFSQFRSCAKNPPKKNGDYFVYKYNEDGKVYYCTILHYTTEFGWNTREDDPNGLNAEHEIRFEGKDNALWAEVRHEFPKTKKVAKKAS